MLKAYKIYIKDQLLDVITEGCESGRLYSTPYNEDVLEDSHLTTFSEYRYTVTHRGMITYFLDRLAEKGIDSSSVSENTLYNKLKACKVGYNRMSTVGVALSIQPSSFHEINVILWITNHFDLNDEYFNEFLRLIPIEYSSMFKEEQC